MELDLVQWGNPALRCVSEALHDPSYFLLSLLCNPAVNEEEMSLATSSQLPVWQNGIGTHSHYTHVSNLFGLSPLSLLAKLLNTAAL